MPRNKIVILAGQEYVIAQRPMRANKQWRERINEPVNKIVALLQNYKDIEINSAGDIVGLISVVKDVVLGGMDMLLDALFAYSPELAADRERIEDEAFDDEAIEALAAIADLAYPLGRLVTAWGGLSAKPTSTNSASRNGAFGTKKHLENQTST